MGPWRMLPLNWDTTTVIDLTWAFSLKITVINRFLPICLYRQRGGFMPQTSAEPIWLQPGIIMRGPFLSPCTGETPTVHLSNSSSLHLFTSTPVITFYKNSHFVCLQVDSTSQPVGFIEEPQEQIRTLIQVCAMLYSTSTHNTEYCNTVLQQITTTQYYRSVFEKF